MCHYLRLPLCCGARLTHTNTHTHTGSYSYNRWSIRVTDKQGHSLEESCIYFQLCCSAEPTVAACVLAPLTELPTPPGLILIPRYDFTPSFSHRLRFHRHRSTRQVQRRVGRRRKRESSGGSGGIVFILRCCFAPLSSRYSLILSHRRKVK